MIGAAGRFVGGPGFCFALNAPPFGLRCSRGPNEVRKERHKSPN